MQSKPLANAKPNAVSGVRQSKEAAAARGRTGAAAYRKAPTSQDALREKVRREMKAEAAASKAKAMEKIEVEEADRKVVSDARKERANEARQIYRTAMREEMRQQEAVRQQEQPPPAEEQPEPAPPSHADHVQRLRRPADTSDRRSSRPVHAHA